MHKRPKATPSKVLAKVMAHQKLRKWRSFRRRRISCHPRLCGLANLAERDDVPALSRELEAVGSPGLFLAGEVTARSLIKTAVEHGTAVAREVARRIELQRAPRPEARGRAPDLSSRPRRSRCPLRGRSVQ